eukprot:2471213-Ditylum_brightwellii.AAC.1
MNTAPSAESGAHDDGESNTNDPDIQAATDADEQSTVAAGNYNPYEGGIGPTTGVDNGDGTTTGV